MSKKKSSHKKKSYSFKGRPITVCSRKKESKFSSVLVWVVRLLIWVPIVLAFVMAGIESSGSKKESGKVRSSVASSSSKFSAGSDGLYELTGPVVDAAGLLDETQYKDLDAFLRELDSTTGVQIAVLTVPSLNGATVEEFSIRHAEKWKLGQKGVDNGALLVAAMEEHKLRIETGYGTEATLTDAKCSRIINNILAPKFKRGDYGDGIVQAVKTMASIITEDESLTYGEDSKESGSTKVSDASKESGKLESPIYLWGAVSLLFWIICKFLILPIVSVFLNVIDLIFGTRLCDSLEDSAFGSFVSGVSSFGGTGGFSGGGGGFSGGGGGGGGFGGGGASGGW